MCMDMVIREDDWLTLSNEATTAINVESPLEPQGRSNSGTSSREIEDPSLLPNEPEAPHPLFQ